MTSKETIKSFGILSEPYDHQVACFDMSKDREAFAIFSEQGTGKSLMVLMTTAYLYKERRINRLVIIAPKGCYRVFVDNEIPTHLSKDLPYKVACWSSYQTKDVKKQLTALETGGEALRVLVMNVEALNSERAVNYLVEFMEKQPTLLVVDESTSIKSPVAKRTKVLINVGRYARYRRICSGNPMPQSVLDLWSQSEFLKKNLFGYGNFFAFRNRFAIQKEMKFGNRSFKQIVGFKDLDTIRALVDKFAYVVKKRDCLNLPPKIYQVQSIDMSDEQASYYSRMANDAYIQLSSTEQVSATMVLTQLTKLQQIANGFLVPDGQPPIEIPKCSKMEVLVELLENLQGKAIIWANFRFNVQRIFATIEEKFGKGSVGHYYGDTKVGSAEEEGTRIWLTKTFQDPESKLRFIVANPASGKYGNTWTQAKTIIYYSNDYRLENRDQSEDRAHRIGQDESVTYIDLLTRGTVEEKILKVLRNKKTMSEQIIVSNWKWILDMENKQ